MSVPQQEKQISRRRFIFWAAGLAGTGTVLLNPTLARVAGIPAAPGATATVPGTGVALEAQGVITGKAGQIAVTITDEAHNAVSPIAKVKARDATGVSKFQPVRFAVNRSGDTSGRVETKTNDWENETIQDEVDKLIRTLKFRQYLTGEEMIMIASTDKLTDYLSLVDYGQEKAISESKLSYEKAVQKLRESGRITRLQEYKEAKTWEDLGKEQNTVEMEAIRTMATSIMEQAHIRPGDNPENSATFILKKERASNRINIAGGIGHEVPLHFYPNHDGNPSHGFVSIYSKTAALSGIYYPDTHTLIPLVANYQIVNGQAPIGPEEMVPAQAARNLRINKFGTPAFFTTKSWVYSPTDEKATTVLIDTAGLPMQLSTKLAYNVMTADQNLREEVDFAEPIDQNLPRVISATGRLIVSPSLENS